MSGPPADSRLFAANSMLDSSTNPPTNPKQAFVSSNSFSYESVSQSEQDDQSQNINTDASYPRAMKREARTDTERAMLIRRPFHWWFAMPMDMLIALTPLFFLSKLVPKVS